ncbi:hypothetical protein NKH81_24105, partial [Mesorhizobium sp. M0959]
KDRAQRPDIWTQAIENDAKQPLQAGRRPHMDPRVSATELRSCFALDDEVRGASANREWAGVNLLLTRHVTSASASTISALMINLTATYWYFMSSLAAGGLRSI